MVKSGLSSLAALALLSLTGCGSDSGPTPPQTSNGAPTFTSGTQFSVAEQSSQSDPALIAQLSASDPDGDSLSFTIVSGKDGELFAVNAITGALAFRDPPSFETPRDANTDNLYELDVRVSDGRAAVSQTIQVTVTDTKEGITVRRVTAQIREGTLIASNPVAMQFLPDRGKLLVALRNGVLLETDPQTGVGRRIGIVSTASTASPDRIRDIAVDDLAGRGGNIFVLGDNFGPIMQLVYYNLNTGAQRTLWTESGLPSAQARLGLFGGQPLVLRDSIGENAQTSGRNAGKAILMVGSGDRTSTTGYSVVPTIIGRGLNLPVGAEPESRDGGILDSAQFLEFNFGATALAAGNVNFEYPIVDGNQVNGDTSQLTGTRVGPISVLQRNDQTGLRSFSTAIEGLSVSGWVGVFILSDNIGNIYTRGVENDEPFERRTADFTPDNGTFTEIVAMTLGPRTADGVKSVYFLDRSGALFVAEFS